MSKQCLKCKKESTTDYCPHCSKQIAVFRTKNLIEKRFSDISELETKSPGVFVSSTYPRLGVGILNPLGSGEAWKYDAPKYWSEQNTPIDKIINFRSNIINSRRFTTPKKFDKQVELAQEIAMASRPVDIDVEFESKPRFRLNLDPFTAPMGAYGEVKKAELTSNPKIPTKIEKIVDEKDLRAQEGMSMLFQRNVDENQIVKLLSVGTLGMKTDRKLVPTRWSITATDDTLSKQLLSEVRYFPEKGYTAYFGGYLGNYYLVICMPHVWSYELFEIYAGSNRGKELQYSTDYEPFEGRKTYAVNCVGGYYAARLGIAELMKKKRFQSSVLVLRFITDEYYAPLGVWVVREATRKALVSKPIEFSSLELVLKYAEIIAQRKFGIDLGEIFRKSVMLRELKIQKRLKDY